MLHKKLVLVCYDIATINEQLRKEMQTRLEAASLEMRKVFSQIMFKFKSSQRNGLEGSSSIRALDLKQKCILGVTGETRRTTKAYTEVVDFIGTSRPFTKYYKLECPRFDGVDFKGWLLKIE